MGGFAGGFARGFMSGFMGGFPGGFMGRFAPVGFARGVLAARLSALSSRWAASLDAAETPAGGDDRGEAGARGLSLAGAPALVSSFDAVTPDRSSICARATVGPDDFYVSNFFGGKETGRRASVCMCALETWPSPWESRAPTVGEWWLRFRGAECICACATAVAVSVYACPYATAVV